MQGLDQIGFCNPSVDEGKPLGGLHDLMQSLKALV